MGKKGMMRENKIKCNWCPPNGQCVYCSFAQTEMEILRMISGDVTKEEE